MKRLCFLLMNISIFLLFSSHLQASEKCKQWQTRWSTCAIDSDCVVVSNPCGWPTSASNKLNSKVASDCNRIEGAAISCASWSDIKSKKTIGVCESGLCQNRGIKKSSD
jgi:hypothetical protein